MEDKINKLTNWQNYYINLFDKRVQKYKDCIIDILETCIPRGIGKTRVLNEISLIYQALGYEVIIVTPYNEEHVATVLLRDRVEDIKKCYPTKTICLVDEWDFHNKNTSEFLYCLKKYKIPIVGFGYNL